MSAAARLVAAAWLAAAPAAAQAPPGPAAPALPRVEVALSSAGATVGDRVEVVLTVHAAAAELASDPRFPTWSESWGDAEVVEAGPVERVAGANGEAVFRQRLVLAAFRPGAVGLPPVAVALPGPRRTVEVRTPESLALTIESVLPERRQGETETEPEPKPEAPPVPLPLGANFWWTLAALSAACLAAGLLLVRRRRREVAGGEGAEPALAPLPELFRELDRLAGEESAVRVHTRLSLALRRYLGRRLSFPAAESTTSEIQRQLLSRHLPSTAARRTVELLRGCDMVKFARQEVGRARSEERIAAAREVAGELESHLAPPEPQELEAAG